MVVAHVDDRAGFRRDPAEAAGVGQPRLDQRQVASQDAARALEQLRAALRLQRDARQAIAQRAGRDRHVVVVRPERRDQRRRRDDPADAQAGQAVGLRQPARDDRLRRPAPHRRGFDAVDLRAAIDLVRQDPRAVPSATRAMPSRSAAVSRAPVGLLGLQMTIIFVRADTSRSSSSRSTRHRPAARSSTRRHSRIVPPNARDRPHVCM